MRKWLAIILSGAFLFGIGCGKDDNFGCSKRNGAGSIVELGVPGELIHENNIQKADNVHILEPEELVNFESDDGEAVIQHKGDRQIREGDVIIANAEQQYLLRVKTVRETRSNETRTVLRQGTVSDITGDTSHPSTFRLQTTPKYELSELEEIAKEAKKDKKAEYTVTDDGKVIIRNFQLFDVHLNDQGNIDVNLTKMMGRTVSDPRSYFDPSGSLGGSYSALINEAVIEIIPTVRSNAEWSPGSISSMETRFDTRVKYKMDITYTSSGNGGELEALVDLLPKKKIPVTIPGAVPVYMEIELAIPAGVSIEYRTGSEARVIYEAEYEFFSKMHYTPDGGVKVDKNQRTVVLNKEVRVSESDSKVNAELFLKPHIGTRFYRVLGPYAYLRPYVRGELEWPSQYKQDDLFVGVAGGIGFDVAEPIFYTSLFSYESGDIFNFYESWDMDGAGGNGPTTFNLDYRTRDGVEINELNEVGFVLLNMKSQPGLRYELVNSTTQGIMVPSPNFYMDGELYYYPMKGGKSDSFKVKVFGKNGEAKEYPINLSITDDVLETVGKERFSKTSNSYKVTTGNSYDYRNAVPFKNVGEGGIPIHKPTLRQCISQQLQGRFIVDDEALEILAQRRIDCHSFHRFLPELAMLEAEAFGSMRFNQKTNIVSHKKAEVYLTDNTLLSSQLKRMLNTGGCEEKIELKHIGKAHQNDKVELVYKTCEGSEETSVDIAIKTLRGRVLADRVTLQADAPLDLETYFMALIGTPPSRDLIPSENFQEAVKKQANFQKPLKEFGDFAAGSIMEITIFPNRIANDTLNQQDKVVALLGFSRFEKQLPNEVRVATMVMEPAEFVAVRHIEHDYVFFGPVERRGRKKRRK